ncbi:hypothetical protein HII31_11089 [Pseudocercospora fuligena]|uniref:F-box domain-containing protein n=1 Tax=Pseudocercospora fuligena TaxID=685502 RepID=A0A8H6VDY0_9PEZI|nr:hypothetical protein HII31_11089 [Pseudocercospora fuligena]
MTFSKLRQILCGLPQLKKLYLQHEHHQVWEDSDAMWTEFFSSTMPQLRHLVLDSVDIHFSELQEFVLRNPLLERLDLVHTALLEDSLDTIVVDDLYTRFQAYWNDPDLESAESYKLHNSLAKAIRDMIGCPGTFSTLFIADLVIPDNYSSVMVFDGEIQDF